MSRLESMMYLQINLVAVVLVLIIRRRTQGLSQMVAQRNFANAIDALVVFFLSDTICVLLENGFFPYNRLIFLLAKNAYFLSTTLMCYFWFVYFEYLQDSPFIKNRRNIYLSSALVVIMAILLIINCFYPLLFGFDAQDNYFRGPLFMALYLLSYTYVLFSSFHAFIGIFQESKRSKRPTLILLALFPVLPALCGISQLYYPSLPLACSVLSLEVLIMYLNWLEQMISIDPLTHLSNRKQFIYSFEHTVSNMNDDDLIYLLMIDANKFKNINDTYGHPEGDLALIRIADALKMSFNDLSRRASIARYGGDEFIVLCAVDDEKEIDLICERIRNNLKQLNEKAAASYELTVSIGCTRVSKGYLLEELIEQADQRLYLEKRS